MTRDPASWIAGADSIFDSAEFNERLLFPAGEYTLPPPGARDFRVPVSAGVELHLRLHPAENPAAVLLLFHGNGERIMHYDGAARMFAAAGVRLAVVDYRGYGASDGAPTLRTCVADAPPVVAHLHRTLEEPGDGLPLIVMGRSLGAFAAAEIAGRNVAEVAGIVIESGSTDLAATVRRRGLEAAGPPTEADVRDFAALPKLARSRLPLLVLHGEEDRSIPVAEARAAFEASGSASRRLVTIPRLGHNDLALDPAYWDALRRFVAETTRGRNTADEA